VSNNPLQESLSAQLLYRRFFDTPVEFASSSGKNREVASLSVDTVDDLDTHIRSSKYRVQRHPQLLTSFWKESILFEKALLGFAVHRYMNVLLSFISNTYEKLLKGTSQNACIYVDGIKARQ
jgi:hypothetical protein